MHANKSTAEEYLLKNAALGEGAAKSSMTTRSEETGNYNQQRVEDHLQKIDPLKQHLVKSYYTLRLLKTRELKARMIQALNYFRGV